jgi:hypothetical protein
MMLTKGDIGFTGEFLARTPRDRGVVAPAGGERRTGRSDRAEFGGVT